MMRLISSYRKLVIPAIFVFFWGFLPAQAPPGKKYPTLLWEITGNGLNKPSYLFGTMHVSSKLVFHLSDSFYLGIKNSDMVALELDPQLWQDQLFRFQNLQTNLRFYTQGAPNDYLNEKSFQLEKYEERLKAALSEEPTIINGLLYRTFQPRADFEEDTYLDLYIYQTGKRFGKLSTGVENYFETEKLILEANQDMMKDRRKKYGDRNGESIYEIERKSQEAYRQGDLDMLDSLERLMESSEAYMEKFLYRRNEIQANSIDSIVKEHSLFVGVGAAHLPGKRGVIELLRRKGYILRPIQMQDKDATQRDDIEKVKVPVHFSLFSADNGAFTVQAPGMLYKRMDSRSNSSWQYADMSNGTYYMVSRVQTQGYLLGQQPETVLKKVDSLLYENIPGKIIKKTPIEKNGYKGYDITNKTRRGDIQRYNIFVTDFEVLVFKMSGTGNYVEGDEADQFFNSIGIKRETAKAWADFSPPQGGFKASFPGIPFEMKDNGGFDGVPRWEYEAFDSTNGDAYLIWRKTIQNFRFIEEDSFDLDLMQESFSMSEYIDKLVSIRHGIYNGFPCLDASYLMKDGSFMRTKFLLKGPQYYLLAAHSKKAAKNFSSFFNGFSFAPFNYTGFRKYTDTFVNIKVNTPVVPDIDVNVRSILERTSTEEFQHSVSGYSSYWPKTKTALFEDDSTGEAVYITVQAYPKYYYPKDSALFWKEEINEKRIREDLIIKSKEHFQFSDSVFGYKYIFTDTNSSRFLYSWIFIKDNKLFRVMSLDDSLADRSEFINRFYASIRPTEAKMGASLFANKLSLFFHDFYNKDSAISRRAGEAIPNIYFGPKAVPQLLNAIQGLRYNSNDYFATKIKLINELGYINDSAVAGTVVEGLKNIYEKAGDTSTFRNAVLKALAKHKTKQAYEALKTMLIMDPPIFDNSSDYNYLFQSIGDSLRLAHSLFPDLLQLSPVEDYKDNIHSLLTTLVDSGYMQGNEYEGYFSKLFFDAKIQLKKQLGKDELQMQRTKEDNNENERVENVDKNTDEDFNELEDDAVLLLPFYSNNGNVQHFFDKLLQSKDASLRLNIAVLLIRNNKNVADSILTNLAANDKYRYRLFKKLTAVHKEDHFPVSFWKQDELARSQLASLLQNKEFFAIEYVDKKEVQLKQRKGVVYFFKYKISKEDEWQMGISGLQPLSEKEMGIDEELLKLTNKKLKQDEPFAAQFNRQLKRDIFSKHKSAASFYLDNDYYAIRNEEQE
jgi:uncharacterized protein YbaP (TraB family)